MLLTIYLSGVLFALVTVMISLGEDKVMRLSDLIMSITMVLLSWPAMVTICLLYFGGHLADKYADPIVLDFRRFKKGNPDGIGNQNTVNKQ